MKTKLILVGGFLGAGKTTLLAAAAKHTATGTKVGLITNDQVRDLVDTAILSQAADGIREVSGSCFCCNFNGFQAAIESLAKAGAEIVIAEPVGSCTDLSATIMQPLKDKFPQYSLAPLSVLVDPDRLEHVIIAGDSAMHPDAAYIFGLQIAEADHILLSKADTLEPIRRQKLTAFLTKRFPGTPVACISSKSGEGVDAWLTAVLTTSVAGHAMIEVDYDRYAEGEAVLGWLNSVVALAASGIPDWTEFSRQLMANLQSDLSITRAEIGHVKLILAAGEGRVLANLTGLADAIVVRNEGSMPVPKAQLIMNARVQMTPQALERQFRETLAWTAAVAGISAAVTTMHCLQPGRPNPTYRYVKVVARPPRTENEARKPKAAYATSETKPLSDDQQNG